MKTVNATLINYFDVWGNEEEGWEVNNLCKEGTLELPEDFTSEQLLQELIDFGFLRDTVTMDMIEFDWSSDTFIEFYQADNHCPIGCIEVSY